LDAHVCAVGDIYPAGEGHDRAQYRALHPTLEAHLGTEDTLSLDKGFWGVEKYHLTPRRTYHLYLPPNPSTGKYKALTEPERGRVEGASDLSKGMHLGGIERIMGRLKSWSALSNTSPWRHDEHLLELTVRVVAAILNANSSARRAAEGAPV